MKTHTAQLLAGAATEDITPGGSLFMAGYPFVERLSEGIHDPLNSTALYLSDGRTGALFIANDVIFVGKASARRVRKAISQAIGIPENNIMISATHTHSGPSTVTFIAGSLDPLLPKVDDDYIQFMEDGMIRAANNAFKNAAQAELGLSLADATGVGTNRHDPFGPADLTVPVLAVRNRASKDYIALMLICCMHPTVLHEDSKLYSGDFPGLAKDILRKEFLGRGCPILYHTGPSGNQSPRHVTKENTFKEAFRLGNILAQAVGKVIDKIVYTSDISIACAQQFTNLPKRSFSDIESARSHLDMAAKKLSQFRKAGNTPQEIRSAEVNWFGAVESLHLTELSESKKLDVIYKNCLPAEIQVMKIGLWSFVAWPGEVFVEYGLAVKKTEENVFLITLANGELQGYIVTKKAAEQGGYEASNATFDYSSGDILVSETLRLLKK